MRTLENASIIVTGASRGIGRGIAEEFGRGGARVVVNYAKSKEAAEQLVRSLLENGARGAIAIQADVSDPDQAKMLVEETISHFGRIDGLVNNAGINIDRTLRKMSVDNWRTVIEHDLNSCFYMAKAALEYFIQQKGGTIINMSSVAGQAGNFGQSNYATAKAGIIGFTKTAALEVARYNVTVNVLCPGPTDTEMWEAVPPEAKEILLRKIPLGRVAAVQDVALAARFLFECDYMTGATISLNGGWYML